MRKGAIFDDSGKYRYLLYREWDLSLPRALFIMHNPSTADHQSEDRTSRQCIYFARKFGFGSLEIVNLYALISTDPGQLKEAVDPIGEENDTYILQAASRAKTIIAAWGESKFLDQRDQKVIHMLASRGYDMYCLGLTQSGHPRHPARLGHNIESLVLFRKGK